MRHLGSGRTLKLIRGHFYWPNMTENLNHFVTTFWSYVKNKKPNITNEAPKKIITSSSPLRLVGIDFLHLDPCSGGYEHLLVITVHFIRFVIANPTTRKSTRTAAEKLYNYYIMRHGIPEKLVRDRRKELFQRFQNFVA